ncbi:hypothetical protein [Polaribacter sp. SA4-10]|uniref:hypothetical protein n=1 Tax=Polaribacter sp. SA4-10 TaxID=754397 RepID=UPI00269F2F9C
MIGQYNSNSIYSDGYHYNPQEPLYFMSFASQKNSINLYHSGIYEMLKIYDWFVNEDPKHCFRKLDIGKSCICYKKMEDISFNLIAELSKKNTVKE